jgi:hypothetical protein
MCIILSAGLADVAVLLHVLLESTEDSLALEGMTVPFEVDGVVSPHRVLNALGGWGLAASVAIAVAVAVAVAVATAVAVAVATSVAMTIAVSVPEAVAIAVAVIATVTIAVAVAITAQVKRWNFKSLVIYNLWLRLCKGGKGSYGF